MRHQYVFELKIYTVCCIYGISTTHKSDTKTLRIITLPYYFSDVLNGLLSCMFQTTYHIISEIELWPVLVLHCEGSKMW